MPEQDAREQVAREQSEQTGPKMAIAFSSPGASSSNSQATFADAQSQAGPSSSGSASSGPPPPPSPSPPITPPSAADAPAQPFVDQPQPVEQAAQPEASPSSSLSSRWSFSSAASSPASSPPASWGTPGSGGLILQISETALAQLRTATEQIVGEIAAQTGASGPGQEGPCPICLLVRLILERRI